MSLSRRSFLSLPLAAGLTGHLRADGMEAPQASSEPLPAPIAALTSMKGRETPITADERRARVEKARLIGEQRIDALMLCSGTSLVYFTNMRWSGAERLFAFVLPRTGERSSCARVRRIARASRSRSGRSAAKRTSAPGRSEARASG